MPHASDSLLAMSGAKTQMHPLSSVFNAMTPEKISSPNPEPFHLNYYAGQPLNFSAARAATSLLHFPATWPSESLCRNVFGTARTSGQAFVLSGRIGRPADVRIGVEATEAEQRDARMSAKWSDVQTNVLIEEWKARIEEVESRRNSEAWQKIAQEVNKAGTYKSIKQCKDKLRNMKQAYKDAKSNNMETGCPSKRSPFYEEFDKVLGSRPVIPAPEIIQVGVNREARSPTGSTTSQEQEDSDTDGSDGADGFHARMEPTKEKRRSSTPKMPAKKRFKKAPNSCTMEFALREVAERILEMQSVQINALEQAQARTEELLLKLDAEQRRYDEEARCRDQEFFLRLAEMLKQ